MSSQRVLAGALLVLAGGAGLPGTAWAAQAPSQLDSEAPPAAGVMSHAAGEAPRPASETAPAASAAVHPAADLIARDDSHFDVDVADAPARAFFEGLVEGTRYNVLVQPEVTGRITLRLKHVTLEQVLEAVRDLYGYDFRRTSAGYLILPAAIEARVFHLSYLDLARYGTSRTRISSGQVTQGDENAQYGQNGTVTSNTPAVTVGQNGKPVLDMTGTSVYTTGESDFWSSIEADLKALIGAKPGRNVVVNRESGVIVVRAMPNELREVADYLEKITENVSREVILEARIVEVELDDANQAGINWAAVLTSGRSQYLFGVTAPPGGFAQNPLTPTGNPLTIGPGNVISSLPSSTLGGAFTVAANFANFNTFIELLATQGHTRVLSSPRVATLSNQKAIIKAGTDEFFVTGVQSNTVTGTATSTSNNVLLTPFFSGVALDVTPEVGADGRVILHVHPTVSEVVDQTKTLQVQGQVDVLPLAQSQIRESDSIVEARSGQLIIIGGLMRETVTKQRYKMPLLGDIPGLGRLFRSEQNQRQRAELVILLRPTVVGDADWPRLVRAPAERLDELAEQGDLGRADSSPEQAVGHTVAAPAASPPAPPLPDAGGPPR